MSKTLIPALAGLGTIATGGGIYLANASSAEKNTVRLKLQDEKYIILKPDDSGHWRVSLEKYRSSHNDKSSYTEKNLKDLCASLLEKKDSELASYNEAKKYCVVPNTISQRLTALEFNPLKTGEADDTDKWKKLSAEYKKGEGDFKKLSGLESNSINDDGKALKDKCKDVFSKDHWTENYDTLLESSKDWCTEEGVNKLPSPERKND
ncbi:hypothetical protein MHF_0993 [Mycoplasma haemofelis Ohio2]|uniref:Uncharacterized protein n=1 Tax=Mycoplasma haemofelis (strain Ohio2) TaxID=859194 RepID=F6FJ50_MYCHI|nr:hypothetical protein MHF_0993 [Mycoplasma haemofelis Ohio2]